jgi:hypothetical protein
MTQITQTGSDVVDIMYQDVAAESSDPKPALSEQRKLSVKLNTTGTAPASSIIVSHGTSDSNSLTLTLNRTIRVPDNADTNALPPSLGHFPLFKVKDYSRMMPQDMAEKGGVFFPMYRKYHPAVFLVCQKK